MGRKPVKDIDMDNSDNSGIQSSPSAAVTLAVIATDISYIKDEMRGMKQQIGSDYVTKDQFEPVRNLVYGMVALILTGVIGALLTLVTRQ